MEFPATARLVGKQILTLVSTLLVLASGSCTSKTPYQAPKFTSFDSFVATLEAVAARGRRAEVDALWDSLVDGGQIPFAFDHEVAFLYRGRARSVTWVGDFTDWQKGPLLPGQQVEQSGIWVAYATFPTDARLEYRIIVDGRDGILDPCNPLRQWGGFGPNSVLAMPDYVFPREIIPRDDVAHGNLTRAIGIASTNLGYTVNFRVYEPAGYDGLAELPVIYVTDAHEYTDPRMGSMPTVMDNLIADGAVEPLLGVFIDPRDPKTGHNRRYREYVDNPAFAAFVAEELVSLIDSTYKTDASPERRAILGVSYGGVNAAYLGLVYSEVFCLVAMQSPAFVDSLIYEGYASAGRLPLRIFLSTGYPWDFDARTLKGIFEEGNYPLLYMEVPEGHSWGQWRSQLDDLLVFLFGSRESAHAQ